MRARRQHSRGFTLVEIQVALALSMVAVGVAIAIHYFGFRMFEKTRVTLDCSDQARTLVSLLRDEIRSAAILEVGDGNPGYFQTVADNKPQVGTALKIFPSADTNYYTLYYLGTDGALRRYMSLSKRLQTLARDLTNQVVFAAEDFSGTVLTNRENNRVIDINLEFAVNRESNQKGGPFVRYYQVQTKATRR